MSEKKSASAAKDTSFRRTWDKEEYAERAKQKDADERERMQDNEQRAKQGAVKISFFLEYNLINVLRREETKEGKERGPSQAHRIDEATRIRP